MKYTSHATIAGSPKFEVRAQAEPIGIGCGAEGSASARIGPIRARVGQVPIALAVPFLGGLQRVGAVGPFDLGLEPLDLALERFELRCEGTLGSEGLTVGLEGGVACKMEIDVEGTLPGRVRRASLEFDEHEEHHGHHEREEHE
jgi:hypothetical protein